MGKFEVDGRGLAVEVITRYISQSLRSASSPNSLVELTLAIAIGGGGRLLRAGVEGMIETPNHQVKFRSAQI
jgi:hypothetical protein